MKFSVTYTRKVRAGKPYEMLEIGMTREFDDSWTEPEEAFRQVASFVDKQIQEEQELLNQSVKRPNPEVD